MAFVFFLKTVLMVALGIAGATDLTPQELTAGQPQAQHHYEGPVIAPQGNLRQRNVQSSFPRVLEFVLVDTTDGSDIGEVGQRDFVDLAWAGPNLSIRAETTEDVQSVRFTTGEDGFSNTEKVAPFALEGNRGSVYFPVEYLSYPGGKSVFAYLNGNDFWSYYILFAIGDSSPPVKGGIFSDFVLINAATDTAIRSLTDNDTIDLTETGTSLTIEAVTSTTVDQVKFYYDGSPVRTEKVAPYALGGNNGAAGDYYEFASLGTPGCCHEVTANAIVDGQVVESSTIEFEVLA